MKILLLTLALLSAPSSWSAEAPEAQAEKQEDAATDAVEPTPEADKLRNRDLGEAFSNFRPSEEISADNAVSFPVDI